MIELHGPEARQIVVLSGKGGTGKTSVTAAFSHLASLEDPTQGVLVDADVDASNLELLLGPTPIETHDYTGGQIAVIDPTACAGCGICADVCRFDAIAESGGYAIDPIACEGCGACMTQCPQGAIHMEPEMAGRWFRSDTHFGTLFHAALLPGAENSGKLVTLIRQQATRFARREHRPLVIVDGPPGTGCPVIAAVSGVDLAVIVAEPTVSGVQDMQRVLETARHFEIPAVVCINKAGIYPEGQKAIENYCHAHGLSVVSRIPFDTVLVEAMVQAQPITTYQSRGAVSVALRQAWEGVLAALERAEESYEIAR
jgi:MinD superfamily P-loop ATPase